ncbi:NAD(P)-binding protein [Hesseltinella vesiculosa]|uniref:NAD(P)-binding protein n=1 Tax=Hesseltinella vesiculosa TaxID=101127 RepID=A0A1X2G3I2_9FUNG|nr:NAD(P)-binding protein [Hesseltinella vesiculosa]
MTVNQKPSVLILGGTGFIGRHMTKYLVDNQLASYVRVADKMLPQTAYLSKEHQQAFDKIHFKQANLSQPAAIAQCFDRDDNTQFDYVFNLAGESKYSQADMVYQERIVSVNVNCAKEAAKRKVKAYVVLSTAEVYDSDQVASKEQSKVKPWTSLAKFKYQAEQEMKKIDGLNLIIIRPALVYGPFAQTGLTPRLIIGRVYEYLKEEMTLLWSKDLKVNTVHVQDVVRACWHLAEWYPTRKAQDQTPVFNLADKQDTDQETINTLLRQIFNIKTGYHTSIVSTFAKLNLKSVVEDVNEKHLEPWANILKESGVQYSPLSPYLDPELLYNNALSVDGSAIERDTGFTYSVPKLTKDRLQEVIDNFKELNLWP